MNMPLCVKAVAEAGLSERAVFTHYRNDEWIVCDNYETGAGGYIHG